MAKGPSLYTGKADGGLKMKYRSILAVAIVAAFLFAVIPIVSEGSDAASMTDGSAGAGYEVKDLSGADLDKLISAAEQMSYAEHILGLIIIDNVDIKVVGDTSHTLFF